MQLNTFPSQAEVDLTFVYITNSSNSNTGPNMQEKCKLNVICCMRNLTFTQLLGVLQWNSLYSAVDSPCLHVIEKFHLPYMCICDE